MLKGEGYSFALVPPVLMHEWRVARSVMQPDNHNRYFKWAT